MGKYLEVVGECIYTLTYPDQTVEEINISFPLQPENTHRQVILTPCGQIIIRATQKGKPLPILGEGEQLILDNGLKPTLIKNIARGKKREFCDSGPTLGP